MNKSKRFIEDNLTIKFRHKKNDFPRQTVLFYSSDDYQDLSKWNRFLSTIKDEYEQIEKLADRNYVDVQVIEVFYDDTDKNINTFYNIYDNVLMSMCLKSNHIIKSEEWLDKNTEYNSKEEAINGLISEINKKRKYKFTIAK